MDKPTLFKLKRATRPKVPDPHPGATQRLIGLYLKLFRERFGRPSELQPADGATLKRLVGKYGPDDVERYLRIYLSLDDDFIERTGFALRMLPSQWDKITVRMHKQQGGSELVACRHEPKCTTVAAHSQRIIADLRPRLKAATASASFPITSKPSEPF